MGFPSSSEPLQAGKLDSKGFRKPKPLNLNKSSKVLKKKGKNKNWKNAKAAKKAALALPNPNSNARPNPNGNARSVANNPNQSSLGMMNAGQSALNMVNPNSSAIPIAVPRFVALPLPPSMPFALQGRPMDPYFMMNPSVNTWFKGRSHPVIVRNAAKKRRILSKRKASQPFLHAPLAPRNTTSFIMRAKKLGGIAPAVTPSPATPAVFPTPLLSPGLRDKGSLEEMNRELGVDGYGSMNGLIRLRSYEDRARDASESESDVEQGDLVNEEHSVHSVERLEQRIDQGLSRFEIIYPSRSLEMDGAPPRNLQNCVISQEHLIAHLEEENLTLKERLFLVEQELIELRRRVRELEGLNDADERKEEQYEESCGDVSMPCE